MYVLRLMPADRRSLVAALATGLVGVGLLASQASAQTSVALGGAGGGTVCTTGGGGLYVESTGGCDGINGDDTVPEGSLSLTNVDASAFVSAGVAVETPVLIGPGGTVQHFGTIKLGLPGVFPGPGVTEIGANSGDTLTVHATSTFNGPANFTNLLTASGIQNTGDITNSGNIGTNTLSTAGDASIGGNLDMTGGNVSGVSSLTGNGTGSISGFTSVSAGTGNFTTGNIATLNSDTIVNTGNISTATLTTSGNATVGGNATVKGSLTVEKGATVSEFFHVTPGSDINMGGNVVHNVGAPIVGTDAANKQYVDDGLAKAFKEIDRNTQGIAIAMAMAGLALPDGKNFALGANMGFFDDKQAVAIQAAIRLSPNVTITGGFGTGVQDLNTTGGRVGIQAAW